MHSSLVAPNNMEATLESKFTAAFEQHQSSITAAAMAAALKNAHFNGNGPVKQQLAQQQQALPLQNRATPTSQSEPLNAATTTTTTVGSEGEKTVQFKKSSDLESFESLSVLFAGGLFTDLVICCAGRMFNCHRVVMAAASNYLRDALSTFANNNPTGSHSNGCCNTVVILPTEISTADMKAILAFIYDGQVEVKVDAIDSFLHSARTLQIKGLCNVNVRYNNSSGQDSTIEETSEARRNGGYQRQLLNGNHAANSIANSPPPSPPMLNSSLASLKALTNQRSSPSPISQQLNGHLSKLFNGGNSGEINSQVLSQFRNNNGSSRREQSPQSLNLAPPAHQSSTPKSMFANGGGNSNNGTNQFNSQTNTPTSGSRRKQKFPLNIQSIFSGMPPNTAAALYQSWLNLGGGVTGNSSGAPTGSEDDEEEMEDIEMEKKLIIKEESDSNMLDNLSQNSFEAMAIKAGQQVNLNKGNSGQTGGAFNPQVPCMIEVEADPTTFPSFCHENSAVSNFLQVAQAQAAAVAAAAAANAAGKRRRPANGPGGLKSETMFAGSSNKKMKGMPFGNMFGGTNPPADLSIALSPSIVPSPGDMKKRSSGGNSSLLNVDKQSPLFNSAYIPVKTAAGSNPSAASPSSVSSGCGSNSGAQGSGNWAGNKWKCETCNKYYGNKQTLKEHQDYFHSNREEQIYVCNICNKEYTWRKSLMKHYRDIHQMRNTPALAEINRQLAMAASKSSGGSRSNQTAAEAAIMQGMTGDGSLLQPYVSIAHSANRLVSGNRPELMGNMGLGMGSLSGGGSAGSGKSDHSTRGSDVDEYEMNENTNDGNMDGSNIGGTLKEDSGDEEEEDAMDNQQQQQQDDGEAIANEEEEEDANEDEDGKTREEANTGGDSDSPKESTPVSSPSSS